jgi:hypothetical protein
VSFTRDSIETAAQHTSGLGPHTSRSTTCRYEYRLATGITLTADCIENQLTEIKVLWALQYRWCPASLSNSELFLVGESYHCEFYARFDRNSSTTHLGARTAHFEVCCFDRIARKTHNGKILQLKTIQNLTNWPDIINKQQHNTPRGSDRTLRGLPPVLQRPQYLDLCQLVFYAIRCQSNLCCCFDRIARKTHNGKILQLKTIQNLTNWPDIINRSNYVKEPRCYSTLITQSFYH